MKQQTVRVTEMLTNFVFTFTLHSLKQEQHESQVVYLAQGMDTQHQHRKCDNQLDNH